MLTQRMDGCWRGGEVESKGWQVCACAQQEGECLHVIAAYFLQVLVWFGVSGECLVHVHGGV
jgi:hypothetical protein